MSTAGPDRKAENVAPLEHPFAGRGSDQRGALHHEQPLLDPVMEVVRMAPLTIPELIEADVALLRAENRPHAPDLASPTSVFRDRIAQLLPR